jgi:hypothetical protein
MSIQSIVRHTFALAFGLTIAGSAFARMPPSLVQAQAADRAGVETAGYRDSLSRVQPSDLVSGRSYAAAGYRDSLARLPSQRARSTRHFGTTGAPQTCVNQAATREC